MRFVVLCLGVGFVAACDSRTAPEATELAVSEAALTAASSAPADHPIRLNAGALDTSSPRVQALRTTAVDPAPGKRLQLVQFQGPIQPEWHEALARTGVRIVAYVPDDSYLVYGDASTLEGIAGLDATRSLAWTGALLPEYKLDGAIGRVATRHYAIQLVEDGDVNDASLAAIRGAAAGPAVVQHALGYVNVVAPVDPSLLTSVAALPDVVSVQPYAEPAMTDERQDIILTGNLSGLAPAPASYLSWLTAKGFEQAQFTASGFGVDVTDSGIDQGTTSANHFGLHVSGDITAASRVAYARLEGTGAGTVQGCDGHGTINAHIIAGYASQTTSPFADAAGFRYGLGVAPFVTVGSSVIFGPSYTFPDFEDLQARAYRDGMRISSNSWGANTWSYTSDSQRYDALVRDAQPSASAVPVAGNQEMVIIFAAGNAGPGSGSIGSPATAKNVLSVGASEGVQAFGGADRCNLADSDANSTDDMAFFSSRGPTADGRRKPDVVAPGTHISGGVPQAAGQAANPPAVATGQALACYDGSSVCGGPSSSIYFPVGQQWYTASSGTSHSTPAVAGAAALLRQYFINAGRNPPSPAMTKAYLMSSARYMTGSGAADTLYSNNQGMGRVDLGLAFDGTGRLLVDQDPSVMFTATGQSYTTTGFVADSTKPFRVTLAWTDAPGSTVGAAYNNDLDLTVTAGGNTYRGNVFAGGLSASGGTADRVNNVESVFLAPGVEGEFTVTVMAANINSDGVPANATPLDQDFALVVTNACDTAPAAPTGVTATANGDNRIDVSWTPNAAPSYAVYRALVGGAFQRIATVTAPPYADLTVSGGTTYRYVVRARICAESPSSTEATATATGVCTIAPVFDGLTSAASAGLSTCTNTLSWAPATAVCGGSVTYSIYRSTTPGFVPSWRNRIATGLTGTTFDDALNAASGATYYYVARATEASSATFEDANTVQRSTITGGPVAPFTWVDDFDGSRPATAAAWWVPTSTSGNTATMNIVDGCHYQSATHAYRIGATTATCGGTYPYSYNAILVLGGNGSTPGVNGFSIGATSTAPKLSFALWYALEPYYDGANLVYNTTGASGPWLPVPDVATAGQPSITTGGYDGSDYLIGRAWTGLNQGANGALKQVTVDLTALKGKTAWFGFRLHGDSIISYEGIYIDDVKLEADSYSACTTSTPAPGPAAAFMIDKLAPSVQAGVATTFDVVAVDAVGVVDTTWSGTAVLASSDTAATLPATVAVSGGKATGVTATLVTIGKQYLTASAQGDTAMTGGASTTVSPGPPSKLTFSTQPLSSTAGNIMQTVRVSLLDAYGNLTTGSPAAVTLALGDNPAGGTLYGTTTVNTVAGVATFTYLYVTKAGTGYTLRATAAGLQAATSSTFTVSPGSPSKARFTRQPVAAAAGVVLSPGPQVSILDYYDNVTPSTLSVTVSLSTNPQGAKVGGTTTVSAIAGVATFADLWVDKVGTGYVLYASVPSWGLSGTSSAFSVVPGPAYRAAFTRQPTDVVAGDTFAPTVQVTVYDRFANVTTNSVTSVVVALGANPGQATLLGTRVVDTAAGVATFPDLSLDRAGPLYTLITGASGLVMDTSVGFAVHEGLPSRLGFTTQPVDTVAGQVMTPATSVAVYDVMGNLSTTHPTAVTLAVAGPGAPDLAGTTTVTSVDGVAAFPGLSLTRSGLLALDATATGLTGARSARFTVAPAAAAALRFAVSPGSIVAAAPFNPPVDVTIEDAYGNRVTTATDQVELRVHTRPGSSGVLLGTTSVRAADGVARFSAASIDRAGAGYRLSATAGTLEAPPSASFDVTPGAPSRLVFTTQPAATTAGTTLSVVEVQVQDGAGNVVTGAGGTLSVVLTGGSGVLAGTTSVPVVAGVASLADLRIARASSYYKLAAQSGGLQAESSAFAVVPAAPAALAFQSQPAYATAGVTLPAVVVLVEDAFGNPIPDATSTIDLAAEPNPHGGTLTGTTSVAAVAGSAAFSTLAIERAGDGYQLTATCAGLASATTSPFAVAPGAASALRFALAPPDTVAGLPIAATLAVEVEDLLGNVVAGSHATVALSLAAGSPAGASLGGTTTVAAIEGVATFSSASIDRAGAGYRLAAASTGLTGATSAAFGVVPAAASALVFTAAPTTATAGVTLADVTVELRDHLGNRVPDEGTSVTLALAAPTDATLAGTTSTTTAAGVATFTGLSIARAVSSVVLEARVAGLPTAVTSSFAVSPGAAASLVFSVQPAGAVAGTAITPAVEVTALDAQGNVASAATGDVTLALGANPTGGALAGTTAAPLAGGVARFTSVALDRQGGGYTLVATSGALPAVESRTFTVSAGGIAGLVLVSAPTDTVAGATLPTLEVQARDLQGNIVTSFVGDVSLRLSSATASLRGITRRTAVAGVAAFDGLSVREAGSGYSIVAAAVGLGDVSSPPFSIAPAAAATLEFVVGPTAVGAGRSLAPAVRVAVRDGFANLVTAAAGVVSVALADGAAGATLSGTTSVSPTGGVATFPDLSVAQVGAGYRLVASSGSLAAVTSAPFDVTPGDPARLVFASQVADVTADALVGPVRVELRDTAGNLLTTSTQPVSVALGRSPTAATLAGTLTVAAVAGVATFDDLAVRKAGHGYTLVAMTLGLAGATSNEFDVAAGAATTLIVTAPPSVSAGLTFDVTAAALDAFGNPADTYGGTVHFTTSDAQAVLPSDPTFVAGVLAETPVSLATPGLSTVTVADAAQPTLIGAARVSVVPAPLPTVRVLAPAAGDTVNGVVTITVDCQPASGLAVREVSILVDGAVVATGSTATLTFAWATSALEGGSRHTIGATATDSAGGAATAVPLAVMVAERPTTVRASGCAATPGPAGVVLALGLVVTALRRARRRSHRG